MTMRLRRDVDAARKRMQNRFGIGLELKAVQSQLTDDEVVARLCAACHESVYGLLVLTDQRLFFLYDDLSSQETWTYPLEGITATRWESKLTVGSLIVSSSGAEAVYSRMNKRDGQQLAEAIGKLVPPVRIPSMRAVAREPNVYESLRKLGELRDSGVVSAGEFEAKKRELLARI